MSTGTPIRIFYHVCMINDWQNVVREQMSCLHDSGMRFEDITVGSLGPLGNREVLLNIMSDYIDAGRITIINNIEIKQYEFFTLAIMHELCKASHPFYGLYYHGKSVSYSGHTGGKYWRDYMAHYNITRWKECVQMLARGNELCGVKLLTSRHGPAHKLHYSGNFFWFRSEYIATLPPVTTLNLTNRYDAEMWCGMNAPVAATMCQDFVDYNTGMGKIFIPPTS